ncbi:MAG: TlpA family protein disulfide reductase [Prevotella sp.]|nr:TlpA family protein disulfide reductase [Prevotella sp.]
MKKTVVSLVLMLIAVCGWAQKVWEKPTSFFDDPYYEIKVSKVELLDKETIVHLNVKNPGTFQFAKQTYLTTPDGKQYAVTDGKATCEEEIDFPIGQWYNPTTAYTNIALHFNPLPANVERFHLREGPWHGAFRIWNITEGKTADMSELFNSNWRNDQTGDWALGLYADNAVYNNKVWKYEEKNDKKVVLTDGQEKVTIAVGKEKAGKRQFTINGQKVTLSSFGSVLPTYPTADNTSFSTEYKDGEAVVSGWIKDFPKDISDGKIKVVANAVNFVTGLPQNATATTFDELGQFTMTVKLNGPQTVKLTEAGEYNVFAKDVVLEPGKKYYMVHDWKNGYCLFMGENARLQNELQTNPCDIEWASTGYIEPKVKNYETAMGRLNGIIAKNPNLSKRYREYMNDKIRFLAARNIVNSREREKAAQIADKYAAVNTSMPLSLTYNFADYVDEKIRRCFSMAMDKYRDSPELFLRFEKEGKIKLSDSDHDLLKKWQQTNELRNKLRDCETMEEANAVGAEIEKIGGAKEILALRDREDIQKILAEWRPNTYKVECDVIDSVYTNQLMRDYCRARILSQELSRNKSLTNDAVPLINDIKNDYFKQQVVALKSHYEELARQNEEAVKKVIAPASNVEGLTDGKAIVEKMIEPYKGKIVYMDVWGTWCQPCINAIKASPAMKEAVKDYDIVYLYFTCGSEEAAWKGCIAELGLTKPNYVHYNLPQNQQNAVLDYLKVGGVPSYFLFDKQGNMEILDRGHIGDIQGFKNKIDEISKK